MAAVLHKQIAYLVNTAAYGINTQTIYSVQSEIICEWTVQEAEKRQVAQEWGPAI